MYKKLLLLFGIVFSLMVFSSPKDSFAQVRSCSDAAAVAVRLSIPKPTVYVGETITFNISGDASTYIKDNFNTGGVTCPAFADGNFKWTWTGTVPKTGGSISCVAQTPGDYNWNHDWRPCNGEIDSVPQNCSAAYCPAAPGNVPYKIIASGTPTQSPTPTVTTFTTDYRCSDTIFDKTNTTLPWKTYQNSDFSAEPVKFSFTFTQNVVLGSDLTIFCQFKANTGNVSEVYPKSIKYVGGEPKIKSISCGYDPAGVGTIFTIKGTDFGSHSDQGEGNVKVAGKEATINSWALDTISAVKEKTKQAFSLIQEAFAQSSSESASPSATPTATSSPTPSTTIIPSPTDTITPTDVPSPATNKYKVVAKLKEKLPNGRYQIILTTDDGRIAKGYCSLGTTTFNFSSVIQCGDKTANLAQDNVAVEIKEKVSGAKSLAKKKIKLDAEGKPVDFAPEVEIGKEYTLSIKTPKGVTRKVNFTAEEGTTELGLIPLPLGDIYPAGAPDDKINAFDKAEMTRQWSLVNDVTRLGDLNGDSRVNSVDYSCLLVNYNKQGD